MLQESYAAGRKALRRDPRRAYLAFEIIGFRGYPQGVGEPSGLGLKEGIQASSEALCGGATEPRNSG